MGTAQSHLNKSRLDKFVLVFNLPEALKEAKRKNPVPTEDDLSYEQAIQFSIYGTVVPQISVPAIEMQFAGQTAKTSSFTRPSYEDVSVNFNIDNRFRNYSTIWDWLNILNNEADGSYDAGNYIGASDRDRVTRGQINAQSIDYTKEYTSDMSLFGMDEYNKRVVHFTYTEAFPVQLGNINYSYQTEDEIASSFTFAFSQLHFKRLAIN